MTHMRKHHIGGLERTKGDTKIKKEISRLIGSYFGFIC